MTCRDISTRFVCLISVKDTKPEAVAQALEDNIFNYFGLVDAIILDNAGSFTLIVIKDICKTLNIYDKIRFHIFPILIDHSEYIKPWRNYEGIDK